MDEYLPAEVAPGNWPAVDDELSLSDYLHILRRRWGWIALVFVATVALAVGLTLPQEAEYEADAEVLVRNANNESLFPAGSDLSPRIQREPTAEIQYIASDSFISAANTAAGFEADANVEIKVNDPDERIPGASGVLIFTVKAPTAEAAAAAANAYADTYVELRHDDDLTAVDQSVADAQAAVAAVTEEREVLTAPLEDLDRQIAAATDIEVLIDLLAQRNRLADDIDADLARIDIDLTRAVDDLTDIEDLADLVADPGSAAKVNIAAEVPDSPSSPGLVRNLALAIVVGAILGLGAALLRNSLDNRVHDVEVTQRRLGLPFLGAVPVLKTARKEKGKTARKEKGKTARKEKGKTARKEKGNETPTLHLDRRGSEAFRSIRTSLRFAGPRGGSLNVFGVTSAHPRDGKTVCAVYLASALAIERGSVLLIDADLRRPTVHTRTGLDGSKGLTDILSGGASIEDATQPFAGTRMNVITAGHTPANPSELLGSAKFALLIKELSTRYDAVVVDCPPLLAVADARLVGATVDGMVLVLLADDTKQSDAKRATELLRESGAHVAGFVLNQSDESAGLYYDEYYRAFTDRP